MGRSGKRAYLEVAVKAARQAGKLLMSRYGRLKRSQIRMKSKNDFVTEVDKKSERMIISQIRRRFADHAILGEEGGHQAGAARVQWVIDPLDGTANYIHQYPIFCISIGVLENQKLCAGVVFDPVHNELFTAVKGGGAYLNGRRIRVSRTRRLADALMTTGIPFRARGRFDSYMTTFKEISKLSAGMRRGGSAAIDLSYVACGRLDGFWEIDLSPWDVAAGALLVQEAGGKMTDIRGRDHFLKGDIVASNGKLQRELLAVTSKIIPKPELKP